MTSGKDITMQNKPSNRKISKEQAAAIPASAPNPAARPPDVGREIQDASPPRNTGHMTKIVQPYTPLRSSATPPKNKIATISSPASQRAGVLTA
jgi:hypothetical protein